MTILKILVPAAQHNFSDARVEWLIRDCLSWLRFLGFDLGAATPDPNTIRMFRERLTAASVLETLFADFDPRLKEHGYLSMGGPIVDATLVAAPKQRNTEAEKPAVKEAKALPRFGRTSLPRRSRRIPMRWTLKFAKARPTADSKPRPDIAIPSFGYNSSISICRTFGFIRKRRDIDGARDDGWMLRDVVTNDNTSSDV